MGYITKFCLSYILIVLYSFSVFASESRVAENVKGIWLKANESEQPSFEWQAAWIWADEKMDEKAILSRRTFTLKSMPRKAILRITASSQYQLFINGEYVCRGPARCAPHHQSYDILDITKALQQGDNCIAVRVHHQEGKKSYQYNGRAGLLAQLNMESSAGNTILKSDAKWKVLADPSWDKNAPKISRFQQVVNDRVDFRLYSTGWEKTDFDDSKWNNASELMRKNGWPAPQKNAKAQTLTPPWTFLIPRDIPYLMEKNIKAEKLIEARLTQKDINKDVIILNGKADIHPSKNGVIDLPAASDDQSWLLLVDFGEVINGMPQLDIQGTAGTEIELVTAPFIIDNKFTKITVDSEYRDKIILSGAHDKWESTYFKPTRYLGIIVKNKKPLTIYSAGIHQIKYPYKESGWMESDDAPWLKKYMDASAKTIDVCTTDAITDNYRERRQYAQTAYYAMLGSYYSYNNLELQRRYLIQTAQEQTANGIMPAYAPLASDDFMIILGSNCLWIRGLYNYLLYSGDKITVRELMPAAEKLMALLHSFTNKQGLMDNPPYAYWLDHSVNDRRGANLTINGHYLGALKDFAELLSWLNVDGSEVFEKRAEILKESMQLFWDDEKQLFADALIDGKRSEMFSEHANAMVLTTRAASPEQARLVAEQLLKDDKFDYMKRENGMTMVTPAMSYFLHKGLCNYNYVEESFELFRRRFDKMLDKNTNQTLWEEWWLDGTGRTGKFQGGRTRSDAQTESAFPPALFAEFIVGITPAAPGLKQWNLRNIDSGVQNVKAIIPSGKENVHVEWRRKDKQNTLLLSIPEGVLVNVDLKSLKGNNMNPITCNTKRVDTKKSSLVLQSGKFEITF